MLSATSLELHPVGEDLVLSLPSSAVGKVARLIVSTADPLAWMWLGVGTDTTWFHTGTRQGAHQLDSVQIVQPNTTVTAVVHPVHNTLG